MNHLFDHDSSHSHLLLKMAKSRQSFIATLFLLTLFLCSSCGTQNGKKVVKDVQLSVHVVDQHIQLKYGAIFDFGNMLLPSLSLPIMNPQVPGEQYGEIHFLRTMDGKSEIGGMVDLTKAAKAQGGPATLPNGNSLPIGGLTCVEVVELKLEQIHSKIYIALDHKTVMLGMAFAIKEFVELSRYVGNFNFFPEFIIKGVHGLVGVFTGPQEYQSGLGFFVDLSSVISPDILNEILNGSGIDEATLQRLVKNHQGKSAPTQLVFKTATSSKQKQKKAEQFLGKLATGKKKITVQFE